MANYFYKWAPLLILGTVILLGLPWLGLFALGFVVLVLVAALAMLVWGIAWTIQTAARGVGYGWRRLSGTPGRMAPAPSRVQPPPVGATLMFAVRALRRGPVA